VWTGATHDIIHLAYKSAFASENKAKREVEERLEKLKQEFDKEKHDLEAQIVTLRVNDHCFLLLRSRGLCLPQGSERRVICLVDGDGEYCLGSF
jgi:hypothetical protein